MMAPPSVSTDVAATIAASLDFARPVVTLQVLPSSCHSISFGQLRELVRHIDLLHRLIVLGVLWLWCT